MSDSIDSDTTIGAVHLTVADLERSLTYYQQGIGLKLHDRSHGTAVLGAGGPDLLALEEQPGARAVEGTTGLYHFALLVPSRLELARTLRHLADSQTPIAGYADHAVSEAIYLSDPDGHGIEIYRDRPRSQWEYPNDRLKITVEPFDMKGVLAELQGTDSTWAGLHPDTVMGHIHLRVADIMAAERFYVGILGFEVMARYGSAASFVAAGGYHHHIGMNTWAGVGVPPPSSNEARLQWYQIHLPDKSALHQVIDRLGAADLSFEEQEAGFFLQDPSANGILLTTGQ